MRKCFRCRADISMHRPNRMFCPHCVRVKKVQTTESSEWIATQVEWRGDNMEHMDPIEEMPVLINVWPRNYGLNQVDEEVM